jgi:hypothetical protein
MSQIAKTQNILKLHRREISSRHPSHCFHDVFLTLGNFQSTLSMFLPQTPDNIFIKCAKLAQNWQYSTHHCKPTYLRLWMRLHMGYIPIHLPQNYDLFQNVYRSPLSIGIFSWWNMNLVDFLLIIPQILWFSCILFYRWHFNNCTI